VITPARGNHVVSLFEKQIEWYNLKQVWMASEWVILYHKEINLLGWSVKHDFVWVSNCYCMSSMRQKGFCSWQLQNLTKWGGSTTKYTYCGDTLKLFWQEQKPRRPYYIKYYNAWSYVIYKGEICKAKGYF